jgi:4-amino-4-deoxy-L-arabinose transferase-like glycosyltransferase
MLFCVPLFFLNIKDSHDWGDDFAQYILQAKNIVEHKPQTQTGYIYNDALPLVAPPAYPAGFPLMLAGVYTVKGNSIRAFNYLMTVILFFLCLVMFWFFRKYFSGLTSLFLVLIFAYNPWTLGFKTGILSDYPFTLFLLLTAVVYLHGKNSMLIFILTGISCGIMLSIRGVAAVFLVALLLHNAYLIFKNLETAKPARQFQKPLIILGSAMAVYFLINVVWVHVPTGKFLEFYSRAYERSTVGEIIIQNLNYYVQVFEAYFDPQVEKWIFITFVSKSFSLVLLLTGMAYCLLHKRSFIDLLTWSYILLFIIYPYTAGGFRFILPVFPFLLYYMVIGLKQIHLEIPGNRKILVIAGGLFVLLQYRPEISKIIREQRDIFQGPQEAASAEMFDYIKKNIPENSLVIFKKPKVLVLYTGRRSASTVYYQSSTEVNNMLNLLHAGYLLLNHDQDPELGDEPLKKYLDENKNATRLIWQNNKFLLYERMVN